jgi:hypothetical protein
VRRTLSIGLVAVLGALANATDIKELLQPGALQSFELQIPLNACTSDKDGLTKRMLIRSS